MQITGTQKMYLGDRIWLESEEDYLNALLSDVGLSDKAYIGTAVHGDEFEVYVEKYAEETHEWFLTFKDALDYCRAQYPEADWDNLG